MCGIAGFFDQMGDDDARARENLAGRMIDRLAHRGPDDRGVWVDRHVGLGHRRLSILDLSPAGHQPMLASQGRYVVSYNGEIFNWQELRALLPAPPSGYRGHSDTEILLRGIEIWGLEVTLARLVGFFALALWDRERRALTLVRDRLGIKPLYWGQFGRWLLFGSELSALDAHPDCGREIDRDALAAYFRGGNVPAPLSIRRGVEKLPPGSLIEIGCDGLVARKLYWDLRDAIIAGAASRRRPLPVDALQRWEALLKDAVSRRMVADVPLGAFLSGGIDSSAVVAMMAAVAGGSKVRTYAIGFRQAGYDEAPFARRVAAHLGTDHTEFYVDADQALDLVPRLPILYDEPFADSSQIPTALICQLARSNVTVALSGDGGDELFGGYNRYRVAQHYWPRLAALPKLLRRALAGLLTLPPPSAWDRLLRPLTPQGAVGDKLAKLATVLTSADIDQLYWRLISQWPEPSALVLGGQERVALPADLPGGLDAMERLQAYDQLGYLADDILTKVDRASMAVGLEVRVPLLDHRLVELSWHLPQDAKLKGGTSKWLLRQILTRHVPRALLERPKMGFGVPLDVWLRGPLRDWAAALLDPGRLRQQGYLHEAPISRAWAEHRSGRRNHAYALWTVLMFQAWLERDGRVSRS